MEFETIEAPAADAVWKALQRCVRPGRVQETPAEDALNRVLASDACSVHDFPPFDRAVMDGYAVRAADLSGERLRLRNSGLVRAGTEAAGELAPGTCARINTGAPMPAGADAVVIVEKTRELEDGFVELADRPAVGQFVDERASLVKAGDPVVRSGTRVTSGALAALVTAGALEADMPANGNRPMYQPADWGVGRDDEIRVSPVAWRGSGDPFGLATANALIYRKDNVTASRCGETVRFVPLGAPR